MENKFIIFLVDVHATNVTAWHVFFFIHYQYLEMSGNLVITLQPAPFSNISYSISIIQCLKNQSLECDQWIEIYTVVWDQDR